MTSTKFVFGAAKKKNIVDGYPCHFCEYTTRNLCCSKKNPLFCIIVPWKKFLNSVRPHFDCEMCRIAANAQFRSCFKEVPEYKDSRAGPSHLK